jgi:hypothetical protein
MTTTMTETGDRGETGVGFLNLETGGSSAPTISLYPMRSALFSLLTGKSLKNVENWG